MKSLAGLVGRIMVEIFKIRFIYLFTMRKLYLILDTSFSNNHHYPQPTEAMFLPRVGVC